VTRVLALADVHLGQGSGYGRLPGDRLRDQDAVLGQIADLAIERAVDVVIVAGDVFEGPSIPPEQLAVYARFIATLHAAHIPVVSILGNSKHDAALRETNGLDIFRHIPGIHVSSTPELVDVAGVTVATLPWVHPGRLVARANGDVDRDDINREAAGLLVATARGLRAQIPDDRPAILALHWSVSGSALPNGLPVDELREPVLDVDELDSLGFDHIVCGHIHRAQEVGERGFYVGSPMPLNFGEASPHQGAHGVCIIDTGETQVIDFYAAEFVPIESRAFVTLDADITGETETSGLAYLDIGHAWNEQMQDGAIVRVRIRATADQWRRIDVPAITQGLKDSGAAVVKVEPDIVREDRARIQGVTEELAPLEAYDLWAASGDLDPALALRARVRLAEHLEAVA